MSCSASVMVSLEVDVCSGLTSGSTEMLLEREGNPREAVVAH